MAMPIDLDLPSRTVADPMTPVPFTVLGLRDELSDTFTLELDPPDGGLPFLPGQFTMLYVFGVGEVPISISGDPAHPEVLVHTIRGVGAVTDALRKVRPGDVVGVRGPFGSAWPVERAEGRDAVFVGGGIGLAPLRSAIYHVLGNRPAFGQIVILYGTRTPRDILYSQQLQELSARFDITVLVTVDNSDRNWHGSVGVVTKLIRRAPFDPHAATAFVCGPEIMMRYSAEELVHRGVPQDHVFLSWERNMKCGIGICGHCQYGRFFVCKDGPVLPFSKLAPLVDIREV